MLTAQALSMCIFAASQTYSIPPSVILGVLKVEGGKVGMANLNKNGSYDLGMMQINTVWVPTLAKYWKVEPSVAIRYLRDDGCVNIGVGAWILRSKMDQTGSLYDGIAYYHSATPHLGSKYRQKVMTAMQRYSKVRQVSDLAPPKVPG